MDEGSTRRKDLYLNNTQYSQETNNRPRGIRTRNPSKRAAADLRIRQHGYRDRLNVPYDS
jgi:hypothetical protein